MASEKKILKLYDQSVIVPQDDYEEGLETFEFSIFTGSRILITVYVKQIDPGASYILTVENSFTVDNITAWDPILDFTSNTVGYQKRVLTDFNKFFRFKLEVIGGNVNLAIAASVFDNAMTTRIENAEIDVHLDHRDTSTRRHDSIRLGDGQYEAILNPDGSLNVNIVNAPSLTPEKSKNIFNETPAVPNGIETLIVGYTVPALKKSLLQRVEFSGENIGDYTLYLNGEKLSKKNTWYNGPMFGEFVFVGTSEDGPELLAGDIIELKCLHEAEWPGNFSGRIQVIEIG